MLLSLKKTISTYSLSIRGIIHIGAHYGQEYKEYNELGIQNMIFFEPNKDSYKKLLEIVPNTKSIRTYNVALGNEVAEKEMFIETANKGMSCSFLEPGTHLTSYPHIQFTKKEKVWMVRLDSLNFNRVDFNMINIDVQGYELEVFKGAIETLPFIDIIYSEINTEQVYKGCVQVEELDKYLESFGFIRVLTDLTPKSWGDALYIKQK